MTTVGIYEAKTHLGQLLERVAQGESVLITKRGSPVAMLTRPPSPQRQDVKQVIATFKAYSKQQGRTLGNLTFEGMIEEGRR
jgi:antitoxin (DNA-binding transcriptional repressor) of toxin-antitoxin stability system